MALSHALLSLLLHRPCSGYDLAKRFDSSIEGSVGFFWDASHQQIYRELTRLEDQGWLRSETIHQESRPNKRIYYVTEQGNAAFQAWVAQPGDMSPMKDDLLVKLFGGYAVSREVILAELTHHYRQHQQRLAIYRNIEQQFFPSPDALNTVMTFSYLTLSFGISYEQMWLDWYQKAITYLSQPVE